MRFSDTEIQLKAADHLRDELGSNYVAALNLAPATPGWLRSLDAEPMYLGLDLRGGVHFLFEVDMDSAIKQAEERYANDIRAALMEKKIRYVGSIKADKGEIFVRFKTQEQLNNASDIIRRELIGLELLPQQEDSLTLVARLTPDQKRDIKKFAIEQNMMTLRNRVDELGVAEPVIQQQGEERIVVQLPGVQDTARAKEILGATATLEFSHG